MYYNRMKSVDKLKTNGLIYKCELQKVHCLSEELRLGLAAIYQDNMQVLCIKRERCCIEYRKDTFFEQK